MKSCENGIFRRFECHWWGIRQRRKWYEKDRWKLPSFIWNQLDTSLSNKFQYFPALVLYNMVVLEGSEDSLWNCSYLFVILMCVWKYCTMWWKISRQFLLALSFYNSQKISNLVRLCVPIITNLPIFILSQILIQYLPKTLQYCTYAFLILIQIAQSSLFVILHSKSTPSAISMQIWYPENDLDNLKVFEILPTGRLDLY